MRGFTVSVIGRMLVNRPFPWMALALFAGTASGMVVERKKLTDSSPARRAPPSVS